MTKSKKVSREIISYKTVIVTVFTCDICNAEYDTKEEAEACEKSEHQRARRPTPPRIASKYNNYRGWSGPCHEGSIG